MTEINQRRENIRADYAAALSEGACLCQTNAYDGMDLSFIPDDVLSRNQGCSSPLSNILCCLNIGDVIVDLGSGAGLDVFIASRYVGESGKAIGIDMTPEMIAVAQRNSETVAKNLDYKTPNTFFRQSLIEDLPLGDDTANVVISNCVINLSGDKQSVFSEIYRVLKPGGYFVISDVFARQPVPAYIKNDQALISRCIGGAPELGEFLKITGDCGFKNVRELSAGAYDIVDGIEFVSLTMTGEKWKER